MANTIIISTKPAEEGTAIVTVSFTDHNGDAVAPNAGSLTWTLTDANGTVINSRNGVAVASAATVKIVLSGADLAIPQDGGNSVLTVEGLYNSTDGNNLPIKVQAYFGVQQFVAI